MKFIYKSTYSVFFILSFAIFPVFAQNRPQDRVTLEQKVSFTRGTNSKAVHGQIKLGQTHLYRIRASAGQELAVVLKTGNKTALTIYGNKSGILEGADGVRQTLVELPNSDEYTIEIGTDAAALYLLEITIH
jgi:hypothetical protein